MKKTYMTPVMEIENEEVDSFLLAGSLPKSDAEVTDENEVLGRGFDFDED
jgi:hypothetical protein